MRTKIAQRDPRHLQLAVVGARAARRGCGGGRRAAIPAGLNLFPRSRSAMGFDFLRCSPTRAGFVRPPAPRPSRRIPAPLACPRLLSPWSRHPAHRAMQAARRRPSRFESRRCTGADRQGRRAPAPAGRMAQQVSDRPVPTVFGGGDSYRRRSIRAVTRIGYAAVAGRR